jgi:hypothetical protein
VDILWETWAGISEEDLGGNMGELGGIWEDLGEFVIGLGWICVTGVEIRGD